MKHELTETSILRTLTYAQVFGVGVRENDLPLFLLNSVKTKSGEIKKALLRLRQKKRIFVRYRWLMLDPRLKVSEFEERYRESRHKLRQAKMIVSYFSWLPTILGIAVTGSVAVGNAKITEDIDLMIVVRSGFLWLTRVAVSVILLTRGTLRRRGEDRVMNKLCINLWLDEQSLSLSRRSLYVARELVQSKWLLNREQIRERLFTANAWTKTFLFLPQRKTLYSHQPFAWSCFSWLLSPAERTAYHIQLSHMKRRTREIVELHRAFFHPRDTGARVLREYQRLCKRYKINSLIK